MSIRENVALGPREACFLIGAGRSPGFAQLAAELNIAAKDLQVPVTTLSGGKSTKSSHRALSDAFARCCFCRMNQPGEWTWEPRWRFT